MSVSLIKRRIKKKFFWILFFCGIGLMFLLLGVIAVPWLRKFNNKQDQSFPLVQRVNAAEIYPQFVCGCCGRPLDPDNICCGDMKQKIDYIDSLVAANLSRQDILMKTTKEFGYDSIAKPETKSKIQAELKDQAADDSPTIHFEQTEYDFGTISQADGVVSTTFTFSNQGKSDLVINKLSTSCGCTSASIIYQGEEGPAFTMPGHGKDNPTDWNVSIAPGDSAELKVYYDPNAHGQQEEDEIDIIRTIEIFSNDPINFEKQVQIELTQTP